MAREPTEKFGCEDPGPARIKKGYSENRPRTEHRPWSISVGLNFVPALPVGSTFGLDRVNPDSAPHSAPLVRDDCCVRHLDICQDLGEVLYEPLLLMQEPHLRDLRIQGLGPKRLDAKDKRPRYQGSRRVTQSLLL